MKTGVSFSARSIPLLQIILFCVLLLIFCTSLFKNISYPLIWNDESETIMMATRVLKFGYPRVHDGKNTVFMMPVNHFDAVKNFRVGYDKDCDAFIGNTWGMYYFGALGVVAASVTEDIYQKTFWLRFPFALSGLIGLALLALACARFFPGRSSFLTFVSFFILVELFSVSLVYHLREARYYSLTVLICALFLYIYANHFFHQKYTARKYVTLLVVVLFVAFHINFITYAILCGFMVTYEGFHFCCTAVAMRQLRPALARVAPTVMAVLLSAVLVVPFIVFFDILNVSRQVSLDYDYSFAVYKNNLRFIFEFFRDQDFLITAIVPLASLSVLLIAIRIQRPLWNRLILSKPFFRSQVQLFFFLGSFFAVYCLMIARSPYLFTRHFIVLQPVFTLMLLLSAFLVFGLVSAIPGQRSQLGVKALFAVLLVAVFWADSPQKIQYLKEHIYQCTHQYKGVLDYQIPYIQQRFNKTEDLVIAASYEEFPLMYYLGSKVVLGYIMSDIEHALQLEPDIVIFRKGLGHDAEVFDSFLAKRPYERVTFPVYDYPVNNIPELEWKIPHLFRTKLAAQEHEQAELHIKVSQ